MTTLLWIAAGFLGGGAIAWFNGWLFTNHRTAWYVVAAVTFVCAGYQLAVNTAAYLINLAIVYGTMLAIIAIAIAVGAIGSRRERASLERQRTAQWRMEHAEWAEW